MSAIQNSIASSHSLTFMSIFTTGSKEYKKLTGQDIETHPFSAILDSCNSPDAILDILREQAQAFDEFRKGDERLITWLNPIIHILFTLSATLAEGVGLAFSPGKVIFTGIQVLLSVAKDVVASHDALVILFERVKYFIERVKVYAGTPLTDDLTNILGKIMAQVLSILALSTKEMSQRRIKKYVKRLLGRTDVENALQRLDMLTQEETRMAVANNLAVTHDVNDNVKVVKEATHDVNKNVKAIKEITGIVDGSVKVIKEFTRNVDDNVMIMKKATETLIRDQSREKLRKWLSSPDPSTNHNIARDAHHNGTAAWFTEGTTFKQWKTTGSLLWIYGKPGSGKSILCSAIIQDLEAEQGIGTRSTLTAYFYFDFKDIQKQDVRSLLSSLLIQLSDQSDESCAVLSQLYSTHRDGSREPSEGALAQCLKDMINIPHQSPIYIIVDAIDECPNTRGTPSAREKVLHLVEDLVSSHSSNLYLCVTSRPEHDIRTVLEPLTSCRFSLHDEFGQKDDIVKYVTWFVHSDLSMRRWRAEDKELVIKTLSEKADGMFRWVFCQLDTLRRCIPPSIKRALNELPTTLDGFYERTLQGIPEEKWQHAHRLFQCLVTSVRPLQVEELAEIFAVEFESNATPKLEEGWRPLDSEEAVLSACSSLIEVVEVEGSQVVQFSHFSVKEFLTSDRLGSGILGSMSRYYVRSETAHIILGGACLSTLLELDDSINKDRLKGFPLAFYAAQHWVYHARLSNTSSNVDQGMKDLFDARKPHFRAWIWIYDIDYSRERSVDELEEWPGQPRATALHYAALCGFDQLAKYLLVSRPQEVNMRSSLRDTTALDAASMSGHVNVVRVLLEHGADVNAQGHDGWTSLHFASSSGHVSVLQALLKHGVDADTQDYDGWTPLHRASSSGHVKAVWVLLEHGVNAHAQDKFGWTPLHRASSMGQVGVVQVLLEHGVNGNMQNKYGWTPLHCAHPSGHVNIVQVLLRHGADPNIRDEYGWTPLFDVSYTGQLEVASVLLEQGADVDSRNGMGGTPLHQASAVGHSELVQLLLRHAADVNARDEKWDTPVHHASRWGKIHVVQVLLAHGAELHRKNSRGLTPFREALRQGYHEVAELLSKHTIERG